MWRKLKMLDAAQLLSDLRSPPGNRLEVLRGELSGLEPVESQAGSATQIQIILNWHEELKARVPSH